MKLASITDVKCTLGKARNKDDICVPQPQRVNMPCMTCSTTISRFPSISSYQAHASIGHRGVMVSYTKQGNCQTTRTRDGRSDSPPTRPLRPAARCISPREHAPHLHLRQILAAKEKSAIAPSPRQREAKRRSSQLRSQDAMFPYRRPTLTDLVSQQPARLRPPSCETTSAADCRKALPQYKKTPHRS